MEVSVSRTDVATSLSTLFTIDPLCFDVAKAYEQLEHTVTCSECESLIDALEDIIDTVRKTDGALHDIQKLRLISEVQFVALKVSRKSIRLQNREFKDYIEKLKRSMRKRSSLHPLLRKRRRGLGGTSPLRFLQCQALPGKNNAPLGASAPAPQHPLLLPPMMRETSRCRWERSLIPRDVSNSDTENTKVTALAGFCQRQGKPNRLRGRRIFRRLSQKESCFHRHRCKQ
ncbi:hypothetical protein TNCV_1738721 [Trichonephila clavipes]|nr:hypothetical protein TNCV_1738721 [Trichonephila clavipes]